MRFVGPSVKEIRHFFSFENHDSALFVNFAIFFLENEIDFALTFFGKVFLWIYPIFTIFLSKIGGTFSFFVHKSMGVLGVVVTRSGLAIFFLENETYFVKIYTLGKYCVGFILFFVFFFSKIGATFLAGLGLGLGLGLELGVLP